jgi:hypothetical protein
MIYTCAGAHPGICKLTHPVVAEPAGLSEVLPTTSAIYTWFTPGLQLSEVLPITSATKAPALALAPGLIYTWFPPGLHLTLHLAPAEYNTRFTPDLHLLYTQRSPRHLAYCAFDTVPASASASRAASSRDSSSSLRGTAPSSCFRRLATWCKSGVNQV